jgi:hypothetical protein
MSTVTLQPSISFNNSFAVVPSSSYAEDVLKDGNVGTYLVYDNTASSVSSSSIQLMFKGWGDVITSNQIASVVVNVNLEGLGEVAPNISLAINQTNTGEPRTVPYGNFGVMQWVFSLNPITGLAWTQEQLDNLFVTLSCDIEAMSSVFIAEVSVVVTYTATPIQNTIILEDFEDSTFAFPKVGGDTWSITNAKSFLGSNCLRSNLILNSQTTYTTFDITVPTGASNGKVALYYSTNSESSDRLRIYVDNILCVSASGFNNWSYFSKVLSAGTHTISFYYTKDATVSTGADCAYIDQLKLMYDVTVTPYSSTEVKNVTFKGYDVFIYGVNDPLGVRRVQFPTWTTLNGQDDIQPNWQTNPVASGKSLVTADEVLIEFGDTSIGTTAPYGRDQYTRMGHIEIKGFDTVDYGLNTSGAVWSASSSYVVGGESYLGYPVQTVDNSQSHHMNNLGYKWYKCKLNSPQLLSTLKFHTGAMNANFNAEDFPKTIKVTYKNLGVVVSSHILTLSQPTNTPPYGEPSALISVVGGTYYFRVNATDHNLERGAYNTHIYAWNNSEVQMFGLGTPEIIVPSPMYGFDAHKFNVNKFNEQLSQLGADSFLLSDTIRGKVVKSLSEACSISDSFRNRTTKSIGDTLSLTDSFSKVIQARLADMVSLQDSVLTPFLCSTRGFTETSGINDSITSNIGSILETEAINLLDFNKATLERLLGDSITLADSLISTETSLQLYEVLSLTDTIYSMITSLKTDNISVLELLATKVILETKVDSTSLGDEASRLILPQLITDSLSLIDAFTKTISSLKVEALDLVDNLEYLNTGLSKEELLNLIDDVAVALTKEDIEDVMSIIDNTLKFVNTVAKGNNLWRGTFNVYNNYGMPNTNTLLSETLFGQRISRVSITPNATNLSNFQTALWSHGVYGSNRTYLANTKYTVSVYWRCVDYQDIEVGCTASNMGGWIELPRVDLEDGWHRSSAYRPSSVVVDKTDNVFFSFKSPSCVADVPITVDWVCPQIEEGAMTPYVQPLGDIVEVLDEVSMEPNSMSQDTLDMITDTIIGSIKPKVEDVVVITEALITSIKPKLDEVIGVTEGNYVNYYKALSDTISLLDVLATRRDVLLPMSLFGYGLFDSTSFDLSTEGVEVADNLTIIKGLEAIFNDLITITEIIKSDALKDAPQDNATIGDMITAMSLEKSFGDSLTVGDLVTSLNARAEYIVEGSRFNFASFDQDVFYEGVDVNLQDIWNVNVRKNLDEIIPILEQVYLRLGVDFNSNTTIQDTFSLEPQKIIGDISSVTDASTASVNKNVVEVLALLDTLVTSMMFIFSVDMDTTLVADSITNTMLLSPYLDFVNVLEGVKLRLSNVYNSSLSLQDDTQTRIEQSRQETLTILDIIGADVSKSLPSDLIGVLDENKVKAFLKGEDLVGATDDIIKIRRFTMLNTVYINGLSVPVIGLKFRQSVNDTVSTCNFTVPNPSPELLKMCKQRASVRAYLTDGEGVLDYFSGVIIANPVESTSRLTSDLSVEAHDDTTRAYDVKVVETYKNMTLTEILISMWTKYFPIPVIFDKVALSDMHIPSLTFKYDTLFDATEKVCQLLGYRWYIDWKGGGSFLVAQPINSLITNVVLSREKCNIIAGTVKFGHADKILNRIYVFGGNTLSANYTHTLVANGTDYVFSLPHSPYPPTTSTMPIVTRNGVIQQIDFDYPYWIEGRDVLVNTAGKFLRYRETNIPPQGTVIKATYRYEYPVAIVLDDLESIAEFGVIEEVVTDTKIRDSVQAREFAKVMLSEYAFPKGYGSMEVLEPGLRAGDFVKVYLPHINVDGLFEIVEVEKSCENNVVVRRITLNVSEDPEARIAQKLKDFLERIRNLELRDLDDNSIIQRVNSVQERLTFSDTVILKRDYFKDNLPTDSYTVKDEFLAFKLNNLITLSKRAENISASDALLPKVIKKKINDGILVSEVVYLTKDLSLVFDTGTFDTSTFVGEVYRG